MATVTTSIGSASRDYSTISAWEADLDNGAVYSAADDAVGEVYNDSTFTTDYNLTFNGGGTVGLSSVTLTVPVGERHDGTAGSGARAVFGGSGGSGATGSWNLDSVGCPWTVEWLELDANDQAVGNAVIEAEDSGGDQITFSNLIVHNALNTGTADVCGISFDQAVIDVMNCIVYNIKSTNTGSAVNAAGMRSLGTGASVRRALNCTVHNIQKDTAGDSYNFEFADVSSITIQNCIGTDPDGGSTSGTEQCYQQSSPASATVDHNLASDTSASGTGSLDSKTSANQFEITTVGSEDLHLKSGADAIDAGTDLGVTPSGVEVDINGRDRDASGDTWDMGAHEFVAAGGNPKGPFGMPFHGPFGGPLNA